MNYKRTLGRILAMEAENWNECIEKVGKSQDKVAFRSLFTHFSPFFEGLFD